MVSPGQSRPIPRISLNRVEVALALGVSPNSVDEMVLDGTLPKPRRWRTRKIWLVSEIEAALTELPTDGQNQLQEQAPDDEDWEAD